jgi:hypothetical protein
MASAQNDGLLLSDEPQMMVDENVMIQLFNAQGHYIRDVDGPVPSDEMKTINFREMLPNKGLYILRIISEGGKVTTKKIFLND